jgi:diadenosine tetraphosphate (Ap4A) HIT family hydrolase
MAYDPNNIFAKILRGEIPCAKIYEDDCALAFPDIRPQAPAHVLVIPKGPYVDHNDFARRASPEEIVGFYRALATVSEKLNLTGEGFRLIANTGVNGGQEVPHYHVHLLGGRKIGPMVMERA